LLPWFFFLERTGSERSTHIDRRGFDSLAFLFLLHKSLEIHEFYIDETDVTEVVLYKLLVTKGI